MFHMLDICLSFCRSVSFCICCLMFLTHFHLFFRINDISSDSDQSQNSRSHLVNTKDNTPHVKPVQNALHSSSRDVRQHIPPHARRGSGMTAKQVMEELKAQEQPENKVIRQTAT